MEKLRIIVGGYIGLYPTGGAAWDYIQYPYGLKLLGHDVYYIEDTKHYPIFQASASAWDDASDCVQHLKNVMEQFDMKDRWAYRDVASGKSFGLSESQILEICKSADVFINISCSTFLREEYLQIPKRILIDSDPMFTQIQYAIELQGAREAQLWTTKNMLENHNYLYSFGENIGASDCRIPVFDFTWNTTRQPVCLALWENGRMQAGAAFTSVMNWSVRKKLEYNNEYWGQKDVEFEKVRELPSHFPNERFEIVVNKPQNKDCIFNFHALEDLNWKILQPAETVGTIADYQHFIFQSGAEFSVAKETYVKANTGWFSCRSACYLAAGKPVITQDTKWSKYLPSGKGLFAFCDMQSAIAAVKEVRANYNFHSKAAVEIAHEYFDSSKVLTQMLEQIN